MPRGGVEGNFVRYACSLKYLSRLRFTQCFAIGARDGNSGKYLIQRFAIAQVFLKLTQQLSQITLDTARRALVGTAAGSPESGFIQTPVTYGFGVALGCLLVVPLPADRPAAYP